MSESNDGEPLSLARRAATDNQNLHKITTATRAKHYKQLQVSQAAQLRVQGISVRDTAKRTGLSTYTIQRLTPEELQDAREHILSVEIERAKRYQERSLRIVETANAAVANACVGTAIDKMLALSGEPLMTIRHEHLHAYLTDEDMLEAMLQRKAQRLRLQASTDDGDRPTDQGDRSTRGENAAQKEG
jgi:AraC-like DNA-binding protein